MFQMPRHHPQWNSTCWLNAHCVYVYDPPHCDELEKEGRKPDFNSDENLNQLSASDHSCALFQH